MRIINKDDFNIEYFRVYVNHPESLAPEPYIDPRWDLNSWKNIKKTMIRPERFAAH